MRPLTLHISALSDAEYTLYTSSLNDLALSIDDQSVHDDAYYENLSIGVREARAWLRGRFSDLPVSDIDMILKQFHPNLGQTDSLSGGQFFAALRLVVHVRGGKPFDRTLAFVQANPVDSGPNPQSPPKPQRQQPPPPADSQAQAQVLATTSPTPSSSSPTATVPTTPANPFSHPHPPPSSAPPPYQQASAAPSPNNPFLARSKTINGPLNASATRPDERSTSPSKIPPLPPRKPPPPVPFVPPRQSSILLTQPPPSISTVSMKTVVSAPGPSSSKPIPPLPPTKINHITSTLMRQSLQASKAAQSMKKAEEELERERVLSVLKSSSANSVTGRNRSASPNKPPDGSSDEGSGRAGPPLPRRKRPNQMPSPPLSNASTAPSTGSLGEVAGASVGRGGRGRSASRERSSPFHTFGRSSPFATGGPFGSSNSNSHNPHAILSNSPFRASPSSMMNSPSGSPSRNPVDLPPMPHSPLPGPPPMHPARKNSTSTSHSHPYSQPHVPPPLPNSFDSVYASGIDLAVGSTNNSDGGGAVQQGPNYNPDYPIAPPSTNSDPNTSPSPRVIRSKSMHYPSPVPVLPPRRRRPESVQLTPTSPMEPSPFRGRRSPSPGPSPSPFDTPLPQSPRYGGGLSRRVSLNMPSRTHRREASFEAGSSHSAHTANSSSAAPAPSALSSIQRTLHKLDSLNPQKLQPKLDALQPKLDKARYKAEAGLSRKGYVNHSTYGRGMWEEGEQGLIGNREDQDHGGDRYSYGRDVSDEEDEAGGGMISTGDHHSEERRRADLDAADGLKWPAGEGWKPLV